MWTKFKDGHSGGNIKKVPPYEYIFIEAISKDEAIRLFKERFNRDPLNETCPCCGYDFDVITSPTLAQLTCWDRACEKDESAPWNVVAWHERAAKGKPFGPHQTVEEFCRREDVLVIPAGQ